MKSEEATRAQSRLPQCFSYLVGWQLGLSMQLFRMVEGRLL